MSLARSQAEFLAAILADEEPREAGLAVYHRGVRGARRGALQAAYPVVRRLVGEAWFAEAAARYGQAHPSRSGDLHPFGAEFAGFLQGYEHARALPYLADVARLEWAVHECEHAADAPGPDFAALGGVPAESLAALRMTLRPGVRLLESPHPVLAIWEANAPERDGTPDRSEGPDRVAVRRLGLAVAPARVEAGPWALLQAFARGATLDVAAAECERAGGALEPSLQALVALEVLGRFERPAV